MLPKLSLTLIGTTISLLLAEILIRFISPQVTFSNLFAHYRFGCFREGQYYWIGLKPNRTCTLKSTISAFPDTKVTLNSHGWRGPEITPKAPGTTRIAFIGDSFTFGWGVNQSQAFPKLVQDQLNADVINLGLPSAGPDYYYLASKYDLPQLDADIVVVGFYLYNDVAEDVANTDWLNLDSQGFPTTARSSLYYINTDGDMYTTSISPIYRIPILRQSHFAIALSQLLPLSSQPTKSISLICFFKPHCSDYDIAKNRAQTLFKAIKQLTDAHGQRLLVILIPDKIQFSSSPRPDLGISVPLSPADKDFPYQEFINFFTQSDIDYLDLRPALHDTGLAAYFDQDQHWNPLGHQLAAQAISQKLSDR